LPGFSMDRRAGCCACHNGLKRQRPLRQIRVPRPTQRC
jgi:hypothetical protein